MSSNFLYGEARVSQPGKVLIIDDMDDAGNRSLANALRDLHGILVEEVHPKNLTAAHLASARLVLVDFRLDTGWDGARDHRPAYRIVDGVALSGVLRRVLMGDAADQDAPPTALALLTSDLDKVLKPLPDERRPHIAARLSNLEWAFQKGQAGLGVQIADLFAAVNQLPARWGDAREADLFALLGAPGGVVNAVSVRRGVREALPPLHALVDWSHGLAVLRWILHRVLPYPAFLADDWVLAVQLRVSEPWLQEQLKGKLGEFLAPVRYTGVLGTFLGPRWWRRAVHQLMWDATNGQPNHSEAIAEALSRITGGTPDMLAQRDPVLALTTSLRPKLIVDASEARRARPDDWPPYADDAWVSTSGVEVSEELKSLLLAEDE